MTWGMFFDCKDFGGTCHTVVGALTMHIAGLEVHVLAFRGALLVALLVVIASTTVAKLGGVLASIVVSKMIAIVVLCT
jgi:hypothetical protein